MSWWTLPRRPEPERMVAADDVEAYASAAAQAYLDALDNTLVEQVLSLGACQGLLLDLGTGPGGIPVKLARRCPDLRALGIDCSWNMIQVARRAAKKQGVADRVWFFLGDAKRLCFPDAQFDIVLSNSLLHHLEDPRAAFNEMARVAKPQGLILLRDLRRPSRLLFPFHVRWYGRYYTGAMYRLYADSVRAAYTPGELGELLCRSRLAEAQIFSHARTHLGFVRKGPGAVQGDGRKDKAKPRVPAFTGVCA